MNCETCQTELEDLLYGELAAVRAAALTEHLSGCNACRQARAALAREQEIFAAFYEQTALEPTDEMWQAIRARIKDDLEPAKAAQPGWREKLRRLFWPLLAPAMLRQVGLATLLVLVSVGLTALYFSTRKEVKPVVELQPSPTPGMAPAVTPVPTASPKQAPPRPQESGKPQLASHKTPKVESKSAMPTKPSDDELLTQQIAKATHEYQGAIRLLERTIAQRKTALDEGTIKQFEGSLAMIDASIAASRQAMQAHPNDPTAARYLLAAYSKKVELMQEIAMR